MITKEIPMLQPISADEGTAVLIANMANYIDSVDDVLASNAVDIANNRRVLIMDNHNSNSTLDVVGRVDKLFYMSEKELKQVRPDIIKKAEPNRYNGLPFRALCVKVHFDLLDDKIRGVYRRLKNGYINAASIGFTVKKGRSENVMWNNRRIRLIKGVDLFEVSLVAFPANSASLLLDIRNMTGHRTDKRTEALLELATLKNQIEAMEQAPNYPGSKTLAGDLAKLEAMTPTGKKKMVQDLQQEQQQKSSIRWRVENGIKRFGPVKKESNSRWELVKLNGKNGLMTFREAARALSIIELENIMADKTDLPDYGVGYLVEDEKRNFTIVDVYTSDEIKERLKLAS